MGDTAGTVTRVARAATTSSVTLSLAAAAHLMGGGRLPSVTTMLALGVFVFLAATVLSRWRLRLWTLVPLLVGTQGALHAALSVLASAGRSGGGTAGAAGVVAHAHGADPVALVAPHALAAGHSAGSTLGMLLAHAAATAVTAALLVGADRAAARAAHWLRTVLPLFGGSPVGPVETSPRAPVPVELDGVRLAPGLVRSRPRRGPPQPLAVA